MRKKFLTNKKCPTISERCLRRVDSNLPSILELFEKYKIILADGKKKHDFHLEKFVRYW